MVPLGKKAGPFPKKYSLTAVSAAQLKTLGQSFALWDQCNAQLELKLANFDQEEADVHEHK